MLPLYAIGAAACAALLVPVATSLQGAARADVTITNDSGTRVGVEVIDADGGRLPIATLRPGTTRTISEVLVPGATWRFRWTVDGREVAVTEADSDELRRADHAVVVPAAVVAP